jgi:hypothetical protein
MILKHLIFDVDSLDEQSIRILKMLYKGEIVEVFRKGNKLGVSRWGTRRGNRSQLEELVKESLVRESLTA